MGRDPFDQKLNCPLKIFLSAPPFNLPATPRFASWSALPFCSVPPPPSSSRIPSPIGPSISAVPPMGIRTRNCPHPPTVHAQFAPLSVFASTPPIPSPRHSPWREPNPEYRDEKARNRRSRNEENRWTAKINRKNSKLLFYLLFHFCITAKKLKCGT